MWDHEFGKTPLSRMQVMHEKIVHIRFDQIAIYDHALTTFYGMNAYLYIADHDEFLIIPQPMDPPLLHNTMLQGVSIESPCTHMHLPALHTYNPNQHKVVYKAIGPAFWWGVKRSTAPQVPWKKCTSAWKMKGKRTSLTCPRYVGSCEVCCVRSTVYIVQCT